LFKQSLGVKNKTDKVAIGAKQANKKQ